MNPRSTSALIIAMALQVLWMSVASAEQPSPAHHEAPQEQFTCRLPGTAEHRQIGIFRPGPPQRCRVDYTRNGRTRSLWSSGHDYRFCVRKALQIVGLLEQVHFKCSPHTTSTGSDQNR